MMRPQVSRGNQIASQSSPTQAPEWMPVRSRPGQVGLFRVRCGALGARGVGLAVGHRNGPEISASSGYWGRMIASLLGKPGLFDYLPASILSILCALSHLTST